MSFIHAFPGPVKSGINRGVEGGLAIALSLFKIIGPSFPSRPRPAGDKSIRGNERPVSAREGGENGVSVDEKLGAAKGSNGQKASGVYNIDRHDEPGSAKVDALLAGLRKEGLAEKVWDYGLADFKKIAGSEAI